MSVLGSSRVRFFKLEAVYYSTCSCSCSSALFALVSVRRIRSRSVNGGFVVQRWAVSRRVCFGAGLVDAFARVILGCIIPRYRDCVYIQLNTAVSSSCIKSLIANSKKSSCTTVNWLDQTTKRAIMSTFSTILSTDTNHTTILIPEITSATETWLVCANRCIRNAYFSEFSIPFS
ncbi:hypothetical protein BD289DRAFT_265158 [Coniella lustricola]|uniref:Uncharacterized protein n=1 Tax=Coniella lustricola TaxID=2025994 RepID=A0A2T3A7E6_9PEZI|nr:hypothetical protein BD289DRAFT_265158 [Coniella lustricola]